MPAQNVLKAPVQGMTEVQSAGDIRWGDDHGKGLPLIIAAGREQIVGKPFRVPLGLGGLVVEAFREFIV